MEHRDVVVLGLCLGLSVAFQVLLELLLPGGTRVAASQTSDYQGPVALLWAGPALSWGGYASEARLFATSLFERATPHTLVVQVLQHGDSTSWDLLPGLPELERVQLEQMVYYNQLPLGWPRVHVCHSEPGAWDPARYNTAKCPPQPSWPPTLAHSEIGSGDIPANWFEERHPPIVLNIGRTMFETDRLPKGWELRMEQMDFVWVPTEFHRRVFAAGGVPSDKLVVIPEPVDTRFFDPVRLAEAAEAAFPFPDQAEATGEPPFRFLSVFKFEERKGPEFLIRAFLEEFAAVSSAEPRAGRPVILSILTSSYHSNEDFEHRIGEIRNRVLVETGLRPEQLPPVSLVPSGVPQSQLPAVYAGADCFVLPSRGEGWGRPHVEAMAMGLPVIATNFSGPTAFLNEENGYPLRHDGLDEIQDGAFRGHRWARPSVAHLRQLMLRVYEHPEEARRKGQLAREHMVRHYAPGRIADLVQQEVRREIGLKYQQLKQLQAHQAEQQRSTKEL